MSIRPCKERWENSPALLYHRWKRLLNDGSRGLRAMNLRASNRKSVTRSDRNGRSQGSREGGIGAQSPQAQAQLRAAAALARSRSRWLASLLVHPGAEHDR